VTWRLFDRNRASHGHRVPNRRLNRHEQAASTFNLLRELETKLELGLGEVLSEIHGVRESLLAIKNAESCSAGVPLPEGQAQLSPNQLQQILSSAATRIEQQLQDPAGGMTRETISEVLVETFVASGISAHHILKRHTPLVVSGELDMWIPLHQAKPLAIKTRSDRSLASGVNQPRTHKAGEFFRDIRSLAQAAKQLASRSYLIYVTSAEMAGYFSNPNNRHQQIFTLQPGHEFVIQDGYFDDRPQTLLNVIGAEFCATLKCMDSRTLPRQHQLRIFEVS